MYIIDHRIDELHCDNRAITTVFEQTLSLVILLSLCLSLHLKELFYFMKNICFLETNKLKEPTACSVVLAPGLCLSRHVNWRQPGVHFFFIVTFKNESNSIDFSIGKILDLEIF